MHFSEAGPHKTKENEFHDKAYAQDYDSIDYLSVYPFGLEIYSRKYDEEGSQSTCQSKCEVIK